MNNKAIATIIAVSMFAVALSGALVADRSDADADADEIYVNGTIQVPSSGFETRELRVNEQEFAGYAYTLTWKAKQLDSSDDTLPGDDWSTATTLFTNTNATAGGTPTSDNESEITISGFTADISIASGYSTGVYTLTVSGTGSQTSYIGLQCEITVTVGGINKTLANVYYVYTLAPVTSATNHIDLEAMTMTANTVFGGYVSEVQGDDGLLLLSDIGNYYWYATGLPAGISMSETGYVSGVPLDASKSPVTANVVATHRETGDTFEGTLSITVGPLDESIENYKFTLSVESGSAQDVTNGSSFAVVRGESVTLNVYSTISGEMPADATSVTVVDSSGYVNFISSTSTGTYAIPTDGTGAYRVVVTVGENPETIGFYLFVTPSLDNVSAGIHVSGN